MATRVRTRARGGEGAACAARTVVRAAGVGQLVLALLREVVAQEEAALRLLHALDHFQQVGEHVGGAALHGLDVHRARRHAQVQPRQHLRGMGVWAASARWPGRRGGGERRGPQRRGARQHARCPSAARPRTRAPAARPRAAHRKMGAGARGGVGHEERHEAGETRAAPTSSRSPRIAALRAPRARTCSAEKCVSRNVSASKTSMYSS